MLWGEGDWPLAHFFLSWLETTTAGEQMELAILTGSIRCRKTKGSAIPQP